MSQVSILMSAFNAEKVLARSLDSIIAQSYKDWEAIVVDDGSSDKTWEIICQYMFRDNRIKGFRFSSNKGLAAALNYGISFAKSDLIARHDSDDISYPDRLMRQVIFMEENPETDVLGTWGELIDDEEKIWGKLSTPCEPEKSDWIFGNMIIHATVMMRKHVLKKVGGYNENLKRTEDYDLFLRMVASGCKIMSIPDYLYGIHWTPQDYSRKTWSARMEECQVRWSGYRALHLNPLAYFYAFKPILAGLIPRSILYWWHHFRFKNW